MARDPGWQWLVFAYRIDRGVSYWAMLDARLDDPTRGAVVDLVLRAPQHSDPENLFTDTPAGLRSTCAEDARTTRRIEQSGTPVLLRDWLPFPGSSHSADLTRR